MSNFSSKVELRLEAMRIANNKWFNTVEELNEYAEEIYQWLENGKPPKGRIEVSEAGIYEKVEE